MYRPNQPYQGYQQPMQYQPRQPPQQNYYDRPQQYYPPQPMQQQYRPVPQQYGLNYAQQQVPYTAYPTYQKPAPVGYQQQMVPVADPWQREPAPVPVRAPEPVSIYSHPVAPVQRAEFKPPPRPAPQPVKPVIEQKQKPQAELNFKLPPSMGALLHPETSPGYFDIVGRGNLPSINFETEVKFA